MAGVCLAAWIRFGHIPAELLDLESVASSVVVDRNGVPLYEALSGDGTRSVWLTADTLPTALVNATLAAEDRRFWSHLGVDPPIGRSDPSAPQTADDSGGALAVGTPPEVRTAND